MQKTAYELRISDSSSDVCSSDLTTFYDPCIGAGIAALIRDNTALIYLESPGSLTFEMQDVPAIVAAAKAAGVPTAIDNTWATPLYFQIGRAHVWTPVTNAHLVCRLLLEKKNTRND